MCQLGLRPRDIPDTNWHFLAVWRISIGKSRRAIAFRSDTTLGSGTRRHWESCQNSLNYTLPMSFSLI